MNNIELALNTRIEDLLGIIERVKLPLDREKAYYEFIRDNIHEICVDLNLVNQLHESITDNRNTILDVVVGTKSENALQYLYVLNIELNNK